ncbi:MAG TPA: hypothetical protein VMU85_13605 [Stellaceae bacterium]|nr:hypothetical protein [Stellaceae bacterium]
MKKTTRAGLPFLAVAIGAVAVTFSWPAAAQPAVLTSPSDIAACLCRDQSVNALKADMARQQAAYDGAQKEFQQLNAQVEAQYPQVNVNDSGSINAYRQLLQQRDAAGARLTNQASPAYSASVDRYNQAVQGYMSQCGGKSYEASALAAAQQNLSCPR